MIGNSWIPAVWLLIRLGEMTPPHALLTFAAGYFAFISAYELGYLTNDVWDASRSHSGRRRVAFAITPAYVILFVAIRAAVWTMIGVSLGWIAQPVWLCGYAALIAAFTLHNVLRSATIRIFSFTQLSILRFLLPAIGGLRPGTYLIAVCVALLFYTLFRLLSYLDSKHLLKVDQRRTGAFKLAVVAIQAPLAIYLTVLGRSTIFAELLAYYLALYALITLRERSPKSLSSPPGNRQR
jgi:hypothetical protein